MSLIKSMENKEIKLEKKINNKMKKIEELNLKFHNNKISKNKYLYKKKQFEEKIKMMNVHLRTLRGEVAKRKRLAEEKGNKSEKRKRREKNYFEWYEKHKNI